MALEIVGGVCRTGNVLDFNSVEGPYRRNAIGRTTRGAGGESGAGGDHVAGHRCHASGRAGPVLPCASSRLKAWGGEVGGKEEQEEGMQEIEDREGGRKHESLGRLEVPSYRCSKRSGKLQDASFLCPFSR